MPLVGGPSLRISPAPGEGGSLVVASTACSSSSACPPTAAPRRRSSMGPCPIKATSAARTTTRRTRTACSRSRAMTSAWSTSRIRTCATRASCTSRPSTAACLRYDSTRVPACRRGSPWMRRRSACCGSGVPLPSSAKAWSRTPAASLVRALQRAARRLPRGGEAARSGGERRARWPTHPPRLAARALPGTEAEPLRAFIALPHGDRRSRNAGPAQRHEHGWRRAFFRARSVRPARVLPADTRRLEPARAVDRPDRRRSASLVRRRESELAPGRLPGELQSARAFRPVPPRRWRGGDGATLRTPADARARARVPLRRARPPTPPAGFSDPRANGLDPRHILFLIGQRRRAGFA